jgi:hypothetical protein
MIVSAITGADDHPDVEKREYIKQDKPQHANKSDFKDDVEGGKYDDMGFYILPNGGGFYDT